MSYFLQLLASGLHVGALFALLAYAYVLVHGLTGRTDLSYGAVFAFSGQSFILATGFGWSVLWLTLPAALGFAALATLAACGVMAFAVARYIYRPLAGAPRTSMLVASLGFALFLVELSRLSAESRDYWLPPILSSPVHIAGQAWSVTLTQLQVIEIIAVTIVIGLCQLVLEKTAAGRIWRSVSDDPLAAAFCGIDCTFVRTASLFASYALVALTGFLAALYYGSINFSTGLIFSLKILFVTVVGGFRSPLHAALGAMAVGVIDVLWKGYFSLLWSDAAVFILLVFLLVVRKPPEPERI
ncbi:branched-chain amino acid ABC transporter permease [Paramesorhizobium deserti]|uniref:Branched-chain amino acid ABC transporter permease n=1 Tax=Paramesorhizobium deserti TaxID=1494590 RepID=A0A135HXQ9_9HYPH|nr:branched-chain amino acid ABC transporter permease [Paramesorhizobium deserti]KXF77975.1 branched-chain amino acid ABC transporter permease [Paramesorhizobium deserti]